MAVAGKIDVGATDPPEITYAPGFLIGHKYEVVRTLGSGGMATVVAARDTMLDQVVAVKVMHESMASDADHVERFLREGRAAALLKSEHTTRVYDVGRMPSGAPFLVMEYLDGEDLELVSARRPLTVDDVVDYLLQACSAISEAHKTGLVHRDLKPQNLFLAKGADGRTRIKVLDFGLAKDLERVNSQEQLTTENMILGSPHFMSPEQIRAPNQVDKRTDIWALGATTYHLLAGEPPWSSPTVFGLIARIMAEPPPSIRTKRPDVPHALEALIVRCLERDPSKRFDTVDDLAIGLRAARKRNPTQQMAPGSLLAPTVPVSLPPPSQPGHPSDDSGTLPIGTFLNKGRTLTTAEVERLRAQAQQQGQGQPNQGAGQRASSPQLPAMRATIPLNPRHASPTGPPLPADMLDRGDDGRPLWPYVLAGVLSALVIVAITLFVITRLRQ